MITYIDNDGLVLFEGGSTIRLDTGQPEYLNAGATVTFRIQTESYVDVPGETWPVAMSYIAGSNGDFIGVLADTVSLAANTIYRIIVTVDNGVDQHGKWDAPLRTATRF